MKSEKTKKFISEIIPHNMIRCLCGFCLSHLKKSYWKGKEVIERCKRCKKVKILIRQTPITENGLLTYAIDVSAFTQEPIQMFCPVCKTKPDSLSYYNPMICQCGTKFQFLTYPLFNSANEFQYSTIGVTGKI